MDRLNFYSGQLVNHNDLNTLSNNIENKDKELTRKLIGYGIVEFFNVVSNSPADLTVLVNPGYAVDQYGQTIKLLTQKQVNLAGYVPSSNNRYVTLYAKFARKEYETRTNDIGEELKYRQDEDCEIAVSVGEEGATPVKPNIPPEGILLADVLLSSGQTQITTIDNTRRQSLISLLIHQIDKNNPHRVKLSQLADYTLSADMNANGKKITGLPAASSSTEPVRKQEFDSHINNVSNPHQVRLSQLADYILSGDMNANGKKITGLPAASSSSEPLIKGQFAGRIFAWCFFYYTGGNINIFSSGNVSSVSHFGCGKFRLYFVTALNSNNSATVVGTATGYGDSGGNGFVFGVQYMGTTSIDIFSFDNNNDGYFDAYFYNVVVITGV